MPLNENKISFIICTNNTLFFEECTKYIHWLKVPKDIEVEILEIRGAKSMTSGYNEGMSSSNSKYKIYMHQDVFLVYRYFIYDIINLFRSASDIGLIGMVGSEKIPKTGIMWSEKRVGLTGQDANMESYRYQIEDGSWEVECTDGLLMATQVDIPWRDDIFDGWDFYDISQCCEFKKRGYRIIVPKTKYSWYLHDDKKRLALLEYNKYRKIFCDEYMGDKKSE